VRRDCRVPHSPYMRGNIWNHLRCCAMPPSRPPPGLSVAMFWGGRVGYPSFVIHQQLRISVVRKTVALLTRCSEDFNGNS